MRTFAGTCVLMFFISLFLLPLGFAQDFAALQKTVETHLPKDLPPDLGTQPVPPQLADSCRNVMEAVQQIYALPNLAEADRNWTLKREAIALIVLSYADLANYYPRLAVISDELEAAGNNVLAQLAEKHVLLIGIQLGTRPNMPNFNTQALAERMVLYAEQNPGQESLKLIDLYLAKIREMKAPPRDRRLALAAPIFQQYFMKVNHTVKAHSLQPDIERSTLVNNPIVLMGVDLDGNEFDRSKYAGKVVLLQFWGTWCKNCHEEMAALIALYDKYHDQDFDIIGINTGTQGDDERKVKQFVETMTFNGKKIPWTVLHEGLGAQKNQMTLTKLYGINELPVLILVGRNGKVLDLHPLPSALDERLAAATSPVAAILENLTEEEKQQYEELRKKQEQEMDQQIQKEFENI